VCCCEHPDLQVREIGGTRRGYPARSGAKQYVLSFPLTGGRAEARVSHIRMQLKLLVFIPALVCAGLLVGCGPWQSSPYSVAPGPPVNIDGNWLISGDLPSISPAPLPQNGVLNFSASLSVSNGQVTGLGSFNYPCIGLIGQYGFVISGSVDTAGTFTAQASIIQPGVSLTFSGTPPSQASSAWTGTYTYINPGCPPTLTGKFTSTPLGSLTGTYKGSASLSPEFGGTGTPVTITMQLTQGGDITLPSGETEYLAYALFGTVTITGTSCFQSGTLTNALGYPPEVAGNFMTLPFAMDDGSVFTLDGSFTDIAANTISIPSGTVSQSGACALDSIGQLTLQR